MVRIRRFRGRGAKKRAEKFKNEMIKKGYGAFKGKSDRSISVSGWIVGYEKK